ncbi:hypothetical protein IQ07DRAFT_592099 [Pyrenochaeta sp. DS3sAY3a]|nr:hypothetical protein IQ07DRAFT_592099 [Pyrenochaeta sp. DS3sAY3a]
MILDDNDDLDAIPSQEIQPAELSSLPELTGDPIVYSGCCLALSAALVAYIHALLPPPPNVTLSIGSGFGLLEALLMAKTPMPQVLGVEVYPSPNKYLPASNHRTVHGSRFLEPLAGQATTWLFVYPRRVGLIHEYLAEYGAQRVEKIIWAGPKADWDDYKGCFVAWQLTVQSADEVGGKAWELIVLAEKRDAS